MRAIATSSAVTTLAKTSRNRFIDDVAGCSEENDEEMTEVAAKEEDETLNHGSFVNNDYDGGDSDFDHAAFDFENDAGLSDLNLVHRLRGGGFNELSGNESTVAHEIAEFMPAEVVDVIMENHAVLEHRERFEAVTEELEVSFPTTRKSFGGYEDCMAHGPKGKLGVPMRIHGNSVANKL